MVDHDLHHIEGHLPSCMWRWMLVSPSEATVYTIGIEATDTGWLVITQTLARAEVKIERVSARMYSV